ncbi:uncharacterized protein LOC130736767 [Lotus japonicus]|uniref:uncharacterized protein LOC130736767 n=1 Tax=Lotus japonicus TaxID=34305 RepID=UPI00258FFAC2|nr:uncharacterized protein LOC130736767 [Lotus japonicus]
MAHLHGLSLCWEQGFRQVLVYSDSALALDTVKGSVARFHIYAALIWSIKSLLQRPWQVVLEHTLREGNAPADFMAKLGADLHGVQIVQFLVPPPGLAPLLLADSLGVPHLRP